MPGDPNKKMIMTAIGRRSMMLAWISLVFAGCTAAAPPDWRFAVVRADREEMGSTEFPDVPEEYADDRKSRGNYILAVKVAETRERTLELLGGEKAVHRLPEDERKVVTALLDAYTEHETIARRWLNDPYDSTSELGQRRGLLNGRIAAITEGARYGFTPREILAELDEMP